MKLRDAEVHLEEAELVVVARGIEHLPIANEEVHAL
jgi:hypothetical protein